MPQYIKNHKYGIEERAKRLYGTTDIPEFAGYLLEDGFMLNFSHEGFQRDYDHREIGQFFSKAQSTDAMLKFMRRGNIRCKCDSFGYRFEFIKEPTEKQRIILRSACYTARRNGIEFVIEKADPHGKIRHVFYDMDEFDASL